MNKHQERSESTRKKLLQAAFKVFVRDGFMAARIEDIAALAGFTRGGFYAHFETKVDLLFALMDQKATERCEDIRAVLEHCKNHEQKLQAMRRFYCEKMTDPQWALLMIEFKLYAIRQPRIHKKLAKVHAELRNRIGAWVRELHSDLDRPDQERAGLEGAGLGLILEHIYDPKRMDEKTLRDTLSQVFDALVTE